MADTVQFLLEEMIPELEDFERRGIFSKAEILCVLCESASLRNNVIVVVVMFLPIYCHTRPSIARKILIL